MSVCGSRFQIWRTMPSICRQMSRGRLSPSFTANSTNTRSGFFASTSFASRNTPRSDPVPPMDAATSVIFAFGYVSPSHFVVRSRHPFIAVIEPPK